MRVLSDWIEVTRVREWDASKAALLLLPLLLASGPVAPRAWIGAVLFGAGFFASAYVVNDLSDRACDTLAGKRRPIHGWSQSSGLTFATVHLVFSVLGAAMLPVRAPGLFAAAIVLSYTSLFGYSVRPVRWKERGVWGLLVAAAGQRLFPMLVVAAAVDAPLLALLLVLSQTLLQGIRWILIHQVLDEAADLRANVRTWTTDTGSALAGRLLRGAVVPAEAVTAAVLVVSLAPGAPVLAGGLALWGVCLPAWYRVLAERGEPVDWASYRRVPGANFVLLVLPIGLLLAHPSLLGTAAFLSLSGRHLLWQARDVAGVFHRSTVGAR